MQRHNYFWAEGFRILESTWWVYPVRHFYSLCSHGVCDTGSAFSAGYLSSPVFACRALGLCVNSEKGRVVTNHLIQVPSSVGLKQSPLSMSVFLW